MQPFKSILADVNATAPTHPAFNTACDLAARFDARVALVDVMPAILRGSGNVVTRNMDEELVARRLTALAAMARGRPDVRIETAVLRGRPSIAIIQCVLRAHHNLVVRSHARDLKPGRRYGAVDMQLLRKCPCPVWLVGPGPETVAHPPHILVAVDVESETPSVGELNHTVFDVALTLGEVQHAKVTVLNAWSLYGEELLRSWMPEQELHEALEATRAAAADEVGALVAHFGERGAHVRVECVKGEPQTVIPDFVTTQKIDLVVMGTVARTGIAGFIMGNTAESVLRALHGSVLAVKPAGFVTPVTLPGTRRARCVRVTSRSRNAHRRGRKDR